MSRRTARAILTWLGWALASACSVYVTWAWLRPLHVPPIGFPSGLAVAAVLVAGPAAALAVFAGVAAGAFALGAWWKLALGAAAAIAGQGLLVSGVLWIVFRRRPPFGRILDVARFFGATLVATLVSASLGSPLFMYFTGSPPADLYGIWLYLMTSQVLGILLLVPMVLQWSRPSEPPRWNRTTVEIVASSLVLFALGALVFFTPGHAAGQARLVPIVILPLIVWIAVRGPMSYSLTLPALFMVLAVAGTARHVGILGGNLLPSALITLQGLAGMLGSTCLAIASIESGRRRALREIEGRQAQLQRVLAGSSDGFWDWDATTGRLHVSDRVHEIVGRHGHVFARYPDDFQSLVHPDDLAAASAAVSEHLEGGTSHLSTEFRAARSDGQWVWVHQRGRVSQRDAEGRPLRVSGTLTDISARKRAERELNASRALFEGFMRNSPSPAFIRDVDGHALYLNPAFEQLVWGDTPPEWRGRSSEDLFPPDTRRHFMESDARLLEQGGSIVVEQHLELPRGTVHLLTVKFLLEGPDGEHLVGGVAMDITERRQAEEARRALEARMTETQKLESLGLLAGGVAHDFNNILTSILGYADLAAEQLPAGAPAHDELAQIVTGARRASELTRRMLAYAGRTPTATRPLSLPVLVRETGELLLVSVSKRITLHYDFAPDPPALRGDDSQLRQVIMNLILNAAEAIGDRSGNIRLRVRSGERTREQLSSRWAANDAAAGHYVWLEVEDDGCGMSAETLARIFDPFFTTKFTGRGLGLAAVLGIVRSHHGLLQVETTLGAGTTFRVLLPALPEQAPDPETSHVPGPWRARGTALVVDDEANVRDLARTMLLRIGFDEVLVADGGARGIELFRANADRVRFVLLDLTMPDTDGLQVLSALRAIRADAVVVLSSGYSEPNWLDDVAMDGAAGFVAKPYRLRDLARQVRTTLESAPA